MPQLPPPRRVALIFPPVAFALAPPLGVALLKAWLGRRGVAGEVRVFDLNLAHQRQMARWLTEGRLRLALKGLGQAASAQRFAEARAVFQGRRGLAAFLDPAAYAAAAETHEAAQRVLAAVFDRFARQAALGGEIAPLAEAYLAELVAPVREFSPDLAGFSLLFSQQLFFALALARPLKAAGSRVVLGGATLTVMPEPQRLLARELPVLFGGRLHLLDTTPLVDALVLGEGEAGLLALARGEAPEKTPGLLWRRGGGLGATAPAAVKNLDLLPPPDFGDLPLGEYASPRLVLPYLAARGCFWGRCAFCTHQKTYLAYREESPGRTAENLAWLAVRHGGRHFALADEMIHPARFARLARALAAAGQDLALMAYAKPTRGFTPRRLAAMRAGGARVILWGVESGSQRVLDAMGKGTRVAEMERVLAEAARAGIWNLAFLLFGFPGETAADWRATLDSVRRQAPHLHALSKSRFLLLAGSAMLRDPARFGITEVDERLAGDPVSIVFDYRVRAGLSREEVTRRYGRLAGELAGVGRSPWFGLLREHLLIHADPAPRVAAENTP